MKVTSHKQGTPSWFELATSDETAAVEFYGALFGWRDDPRPLPDGTAYHMQFVEDDSVGAIARQQADEVAQSIPPHWNVYLAVDDIDATVGRVASEGGTVIAPPFDVMESGRMAVIADPTGAVVCLWQGKNHPGAGRMNEPGSPTWAELVTTDPERAAAFFGELLGMEIEKSEMPGGGAYILLKVDGQEVAGVAELTAEMGEMPPVWGAYFEVSDVDATAERAPSLGAQVLVPPTDIPGARFAVIADPQGAVVGVMTATA